MTNPNDPDNPCQRLDAQGMPREEMQPGLTKRELFAAMILQGLCANPDRQCTYENDAEAAVKQADALFAQLNLSEK